MHQRFIDRLLAVEEPDPQFVMLQTGAMFLDRFRGEHVQTARLGHIAFALGILRAQHVRREFE